MAMCWQAEGEEEEEEGRRGACNSDAYVHVSNAREQRRAGERRKDIAGTHSYEDYASIA